MRLENTKSDHVSRRSVLDNLRFVPILAFTFAGLLTGVLQKPGEEKCFHAAAAERAADGLREFARHAPSSHIPTPTPLATLPMVRNTASTL